MNEIILLFSPKILPFPFTQIYCAVTSTNLQLKESHQRTAALDRWKWHLGLFSLLHMQASNGNNWPVKLFHYAFAVDFTNKTTYFVLTSGLADLSTCCMLEIWKKRKNLICIHLIWIQIWKSSTHILVLWLLEVDRYFLFWITFTIISKSVEVKPGWNSNTCFIIVTKYCLHLSLNPSKLFVKWLYWFLP